MEKVITTVQEKQENLRTNFYYPTQGANYIEDMENLAPAKSEKI